MTPYITGSYLLMYLICFQQHKTPDVGKLVRVETFAIFPALLHKVIKAISQRIQHSAPLILFGQPRQKMTTDKRHALDSV